MSQDWNIKARGDICTVCNRAFADGEEFTSRLVFGEQGYVRDDICPACWQEASRQSALSVWKTTFHMPAPPRPEPLQKETAESLLRKLMETDDASHRNAIFILAVMLERKRVLAERDVQVREDGVKIRVYEHKKTNETFLVPDPGLRLAELETVQKEVLALLGVADKPAEPQPAAAAEPAVEGEAPPADAE